MNSPKSNTKFHTSLHSTLASGTFFSSLIDDICIYNRVVSP